MKFLFTVFFIQSVLFPVDLYAKRGVYEGIKESVKSLILRSVKRSVKDDGYKESDLDDEWMIIKEETQGSNLVPSAEEIPRIRTSAVGLSDKEQKAWASKQANPFTSESHLAPVSMGDKITTGNVDDWAIVSKNNHDKNGWSIDSVSPAQMAFLIKHQPKYKLSPRNRSLIQRLGHSDIENKNEHRKRPVRHILPRIAVNQKNKPKIDMTIEEPLSRKCQFFKTFGVEKDKKREFSVKGGENKKLYFAPPPRLKLTPRTARYADKDMPSLQNKEPFKEGYVDYPLEKNPFHQSYADKLNPFLWADDE